MKKILITWDSSQSVVMCVKVEDDFDTDSFEAGLESVDHIEDISEGEPPPALLKLEELTKENKMEFSNITDVGLKNFKVREM